MSVRLYQFTGRATPVPFSATTRAHAEGVQLGYVQGVRDGRLAGFCWGLLLGAAGVAACFYFGWTKP